MMDVVITQEQYKKIKNNLANSNPNVINEAWYNTVMDVLGIIDPTPVVDIINSVSYFSQGEYLFAILTLISAIPYAGDAVGKTLLGSAKVGGQTTKGLKTALDLAKGAKVGSKEYKLAGEAIEKLAKDPGLVGSFIQKMGSGLGQKAITTVEHIPAGPLKGFKNLIMDYLTLLTRAGEKSTKFKGAAKGVAAEFKAGTAGIKDIQVLKDLLKAEKVFDVAALSKPGMFSKIFIGGAPRLFGNRRLRIMMRQTKWWYGFLRYMGIVGDKSPDDLLSSMPKSEFFAKMDEYNKTPEAKNNFFSEFGQGSEAEPQQQPQYQAQTNQPTQQIDPMQYFFKNLFTGAIA